MDGSKCLKTICKGINLNGSFVQSEFLLSPVPCKADKCFSSLTQNFEMLAIQTYRNLLVFFLEGLTTVYHNFHRKKWKPKYLEKIGIQYFRGFKSFSQFFFLKNDVFSVDLFRKYNKKCSFASVNLYLMYTVFRTHSVRFIYCSCFTLQEELNSKWMYWWPQNWILYARWVSWEQSRGTKSPPSTCLLILSFFWTFTQWYCWGKNRSCTVHTEKVSIKS